VRILCLSSLLLFAACGGKQGPPPKGSPQAVAQATFEALKAGDLGPLKEHLMTPEEAKRLTTVALDDSEERERWDRLISQEHEELGVDWATAKLGTTRLKVDPIKSGSVTVTFDILSDKGSARISIEVLRVGSRYVFQDLKPPKAAPPPKEAAPAGEDDGCGG